MAGVNARIIKDFDPRKLDDLLKRLGGPATVNVGFPATGEQHRESEGMSVAEVAAVHEFGSLNMPERSFLRAGIRKNLKAYHQLNKKTLRQVLLGRMTLVHALGLLGEQAKSDVQTEITDGDFAPLSEATIKRKGSSKPLIDSGQMRQSVAWEYGDD